MKAARKENKYLQASELKQAYLSFMSDLFELPVEYKGKEMLCLPNYCPWVLRIR
jgi:hypothetical protein